MPGPEGWEPGTVLRPTVLSLHSGSPPSDANEAAYEGCYRLEALGESWTRKPGGKWSNDFAMEFPAPPAGSGEQAPAHIRAACRDGRCLCGPLPAAARKRDPIRIEPGELSLKLEEASA